METQLPDKTKTLVQQFWNTNPCGSKFATQVIGSREFFAEIESHRYRSEWHIPRTVGFERWSGREVLEVGCGLGTDAVQFARNGARYTGVDLTPRSIELTALRFRQEKLNGRFLNADAENLPFPDDSFDLVYSHGVLHHTPNTERAIQEVHRVLNPGGQAMIMLYHRRSYNYYGNIMFLRRLGARLLAFNGGRRLVARMTGESLESVEVRARAMQLDPETFWQKEHFLSDNTDGAGNPVSKVFTRAEAGRMFKNFAQVRTSVRFLNKKWVPLFGRYLPRAMDGALGRLCGWHLWIFAKK
jgi:ubiquinone/menaquinone biosynthesis C-methylase UbiE